MTRGVLAGVLCLSLAAGLAAAAAEHAGPCRYGEPRVLATIADERLDECSGLAAGHRNPDVLWAHNDSGDGPRLFAIDRTGRTRAVVSVKGAAARDWEDIASGPGPDGTPSLFIGDIGNNTRKRTDLTVYRVAEPVLQEGVSEITVEVAEAIHFRYPDGNFDAEALLAHPRSGDLYLIVKDTGGKPGVYRFPRAPRAESVTLERVGVLPIPEPSIWGRMVTAAAIAPDGARLVIRTYLSVLEYRAPAGEGIEAALAATPVKLPAPPELQGEALTYAADGHGILTAAEGRKPRLFLLPCDTR